jgi:sensor histidine kinase YesM
MKVIKKHIMSWLAYLCFLLIYALSRDINFDKTTFLLGNILLISIFYYNYLFALKYLTWKTVGSFILYTLIGILAYLNLRYLLTHKLLPLMGKKVYDDLRTNWFVSGHIYYYITFTVYAALFLLYKKHIEKERQNSNLLKQKYELEKDVLILEKENIALENQQLELEKEKLQAEYNYLKVQINPHFLYNTLSYFVSNTMRYNKDLGNGLAKLSGIMHYSLQKTPPHGKVSLVSELETMDNYIELQSLRYGKHLNMQYTKMGILQGYSIIPHILITVVENAFKHGNTRSETQPLVISIKVVDDTLYFNVVNAIDKVGLQRSDTSIGVDNMRKRLALYYAGAHVMQVKQTHDVYSTHIIIPLKDEETTMIN